jgi:signal transduction histidine kinase
LSIPRYSLAFSVGRDLLIALLAFAAATLVSLTVQLEMTKHKLREDSLDRAARYIALHLQVDPTGEARLATLPGESSVNIGYPVVVFDRDGRVLLERPAGLDPALVDALVKQRLAAPAHEDHAASIGFFTLALEEKRIVGAALHTGPDSNERVIVVFKDENGPDVLVDDIVGDFPYQSARVLLPLFALLLLAGGWIVWHRMRPIAQVSAIAGTIGPRTLNLRLPERGLPAELLPIVRGVNGALERLEHAAEVQREFLRHAAHQLRTPLMVLSARAESLDDTETAFELRGDVKELSRIISQLLQLNEIDTLPDGEAVADLGAVGEAVRDELAPRAAMQDKNIELTPPGTAVLVRGDPNVIEIAVRNLVENAIEHAPPGSTIGLLIGADAHLEVVDAGPGVADELRDQIFEPFWSGDPHGVSAGLGLTIVSHVAERYGASIRVTAPPCGGARFSIGFQPAGVRPSDLDAATARASIPAGLAQRRRREALDRTAV